MKAIICKRNGIEMVTLNKNNSLQYIIIENNYDVWYITIEIWSQNDYIKSQLALKCMAAL